jgi:hypothetical protein
MIDPISYVFLLLGFDPAQSLAALVLTMLFCNFLARLIPDDSTGLLGIIHKAASIIGLSVSNRLTSNFTTTDAAKVILEEVKDDLKPPARANGFISPRLLPVIGVVALGLILMGCTTLELARVKFDKICARHSVIIDGTQICPPTN